MKAISYLNIKDLSDILLIDKLDIDYIHVDVMDNLFVPNKTVDENQLFPILKKTTKPLDVHLMVEDVYKYIDLYKTINPKHITFHLEVKNTLEIINYIKKQNIKVGIAINPNTPITSLIPFLHLIDLVLIMSVEPGYGGQTFITDSILKIKKLSEYKNENNLNFLIEIDGGINNTTYPLVKEITDISVIGSYITTGDYNNNLNTLK
ncbi:MAG: ribulose-phosphate 3-epimerase [Mycoplasmatota bacterium]